MHWKTRGTSDLLFIKLAEKGRKIYENVSQENVQNITGTDNNQEKSYGESGCTIAHESVEDEEHEDLRYIDADEFHTLNKQCLYGTRGKR